MKTNIFYLLIFSFMTLISCQKNLDLTPKDKLSDASFWKTTKDFELAANEFYYGLKQVPNYTDNNSDIAFGTGPNSVSNGSYLAPATSPEWDTAYTNIREINYLLMKSENSDLGENINRWIGEAQFFRAYNYWNLVSKFGGVPKIDKVLEVTSEELYTARSTQEEIIDFLLSDLEQAISKLPQASELKEEEKGRITKGAALALRARAALFQGTWEKYHGEANSKKYLNIAVQAAEELINSGEYSLYKGKGSESYKNLFILAGDDSEEVILARRYYTNRIMHNWTRELWFNAMVPTKNMADLYLSIDGLPIEKSPLFQGYSKMNSEFINRDPRMGMTFIVPGSKIFFEGGIQQITFPGFTGSNATHSGYMLRKFLDETIEAATFRGAYDFKEIRYAEVLLILAESLYERDGSISDVNLNKTINELRQRVGMPDLTNAIVSMNNLNMISEIRRERTVELAFEGFRRDDLRRWKTAENELPKALKGVLFVGSEFQDRYPTLKVGTDITVDQNGFIIAENSTGRRFLTKHYYDPIPLQEVQLSKGNLKQNQGW